MSRHTTFRYRLDPTTEQHTTLTRHAGAARFAFNQCLHLVKTALAHRETDADHPVPWTGFSLINAFNRWKKSEAAGRMIAVGAGGVAEVRVTGLPWRDRVCQQVFEEAAVDCGRALAAWSDSRSGNRAGRRVGFPRFKSKHRATPAFRLRNKNSNSGRQLIRVGDGELARSVTLPGLGVLRVREDTRRLRRMLAKGRARILYATVTQRAGRWWVSLATEAADLHPAHHHPSRDPGDTHGYVGVDRGLTEFLVAATAEGTEVARVDPSKPLAAGLARQRRLSQALSRTQKGSRNRDRAAARLARHHRKVADIRRHFLHQVTGALVKTHDRLVIEDLHVAGLLRNHRLARAISDAGWTDFARLLRYKQDWRHGTVITADRWFPSSKRCSACDTVNTELALADRVFACGCGLRIDRELNAAINLARWPIIATTVSRSPDLPARGRVTKARRREGADRHPVGAGATGPADAGTDTHPIPG
ncbi:RNA-guided endonuclease TnpB family protein [Nocardia otitidiscaviarum]|uniref:RNA-guided endonuclease TnpB family protein n=1 Tax=Nocardia otitidiscaviarum TaxID=1823 RepID=UPI00189307A2|nr:RNA-guided endonuclease TnpB family protein [Nocardia otitidiscaviarum]MBF6178524.1 transposase [Nocardia otitidiscaviarum]